MCPDLFHSRQDVWQVPLIGCWDHCRFSIEQTVHMLYFHADPPTGIENLETRLVIIH